MTLKGVCVVKQIHEIKFKMNLLLPWKVVVLKSDEPVKSFDGQAVVNYSKDWRMQTNDHNC